MKTKASAGQIESYMTGDGLTTSRSYEPETGRLTGILTLNGNDTIQNYSYGYDLIANLAARTDSVHNMREDFIYDRLNRLTGIVESGDTTARFVYDAYGRMLSKRMHSAMVFDSAAYDAGGRPHAISQAKTSGNPPLHRMGYTHFDKLARLEQDTMMLSYTYGYEHQRLHLTEATTYGDTIREKDYVGNCEYIDDGIHTTMLTYFGGPLGVFGVQKQIDDGRPDQYFIHPDHLGSWTLVADPNSNIAQDVAFDAWGTPYRFTTTGTVPADTLLFDRGFTGHEHLSYFGLINMNGRCYDPFTSGFLSVDNYVQSPDYTQSFNRYAYCLNNPLKYTDPDGEFFVLDSWLSGFFQGYFSTDENQFSNGLAKARQLAANDKKIWGGLSQTDSHKDFWGRTWEFVSRFTWQLPQTIVGFGFTQVSNLGGQVDNVDYYGGATVASGNYFEQGGAVTLGSFINGPSFLSADPNNFLFQHEYGHYLQSQEMGFAYLNRVGIPSLLSNHDHDFHPVEQDANRRAFLYFNKHIRGFYKTEENKDNDYGWNFYANPLNVYYSYEDGLYVDYNNVNSLELLNNLTVHAQWYDYVCWKKYKYGPILIGLINAIYYNFLHQMP